MKLQILTNDEKLASICKDYWRLDEPGVFVFTVKEIAAIYDIKPHLVSSLAEKNCYFTLSTICCAVCMQPVRFKNRSQYNNRSIYINCICKNCRMAEQKAIEEETKMALMRLREVSESKAIDSIAKPDYISMIYLLATIQGLGDEDLITIEPLGSKPYCTLTPDPSYDLQVLETLYEKGLLLISLRTGINQLNYLRDDTATVDFEHTAFDLSINPEQVVQLFDRFADKEILVHIKRAPEFIELCKEIQLHECLSFLRRMLHNHQLPFSPGPKTFQILSQCLADYSVAQVWVFIWGATRDAAAYYMRGSISKRHAANSAVGNISRSWEKCMAKGWDVKPFGRNPQLPQSSLSRVVFNTVLGTDDEGFNKRLKDLLEPNSHA